MCFNNMGWAYVGVDHVKLDPGPNLRFRLPTFYIGSLKIDGGGAVSSSSLPHGSNSNTSLFPKKKLKYVLQIIFEVSYNKVEYEALLHGLRLAISLEIKRLLVFRGSKLVARQINKEWDINNKRMDDYVVEVRKLIAGADLL